MILNASQRGGAKQLAQHLMRTDDNEHVEVHEIRGFVSDDVTGALKEAYAVSKGTQCKQFLFSVSLNPPQSENVGVDVFEDAANRIEVKNGLDGQPRIIVFHEKEGRRHAHAVWSRIDAETMTAKNLPFYKLKVRDISRDIYMEQDWKMPRGLMNSEERDPRNFTLAEWQQSKRMGWNARDLKETLQDCWAVSDSKAAFDHALKERGLTLAKGDRRGHVVVNHDGEVMAVTRLTGKRAKEVRAKLGEADTLPSVDDAKDQISNEMVPVIKRHLQEQRDQHQRETAPLNNERQRMTLAHRAERQKLDAAQDERWTRETAERSARVNKGLLGLVDRLSGRRAKIIRDNEEQAYAALERDREQRQELIDVQLRDRCELQSQILDMRMRQADELRSLRKDRDHYRNLARPDPPEKEIQKATAQSRPGAQHATEASSLPDIKSSFDRLAALRESGAANDQTLQPNLPTPQQRLERMRENQPVQQSAGQENIQAAPEPAPQSQPQAEPQPPTPEPDR